MFKRGQNIYRRGAYAREMGPANKGWEQIFMGFWHMRLWDQITGEKGHIGGFWGWVGSSRSRSSRRITGVIKPASKVKTRLKNG